MLGLRTITAMSKVLLNNIIFIARLNKTSHSNNKLKKLKRLGFRKHASGSLDYEEHSDLLNKFEILLHNKKAIQILKVNLINIIRDNRN